MAAHNDHQAGDDAHLVSLRQALGIILSPKRSQTTRSNTASGTASPASHQLHSAIPLSPAHSNSSTHPSSGLSNPHPHPHVNHAHHQHPLRPAQHHQTLHGHEHPPPPGVESAHLHPVHDPHPQAPDAVVSAVGESGNMTPGSRTRFIEALQSKNKSWDAMIHGSWV